MLPTKPLYGFLWKLLATFLLYLSYFAEGRTYVLLKLGVYITGLVDGVILSLSFSVLVLYLREVNKEK